MDHPGVRADLGAFIGAVATAAARYPAFYAIMCGATPAVFRDSRRILLLPAYRGSFS